MYHYLDAFYHFHYSDYFLFENLCNILWGLIREFARCICGFHYIYKYIFNYIKVKCKKIYGSII